MKLTDLDAQFLQWRQEQPDAESRADNPQWPADYMQDVFAHVGSISDAHGIRFACPKARSAGQSHQIRVFFEGSPVPAHLGKNKDGVTVRWKASGTGYQDLTLTPSIQEQCGQCEWHGHVTNGDAT